MGNREDPASPSPLRRSWNATTSAPSTSTSPGGVLFELATDIPGFAIDEPVESLGEQLRVPIWLEPHLAVMTRHLPPVTLHKPKVEVLS